MLQLRTREVRGRTTEAYDESITPIGRLWTATVSTPWGVVGRHYLHPVRVETRSGGRFPLWDFVMIAKLAAGVALLCRRGRP